MKAATGASARARAVKKSCGGAFASALATVAESSAGGEEDGEAGAGAGRHVRRGAVGAGQWWRWCSGGAGGERCREGRVCETWRGRRGGAKRRGGVEGMHATSPRVRLNAFAVLHRAGAHGQGWQGAGRG